MEMLRLCFECTMYEGNTKFLGAKIQTYLIKGII